MTSPSTPRRPGERQLRALGLDSTALHPDDASGHTFPDGGRWRTEVPSVEGPEAVHTVLTEAQRLDVMIHRISQGSGIWMLTDAEITDMVQACAESNVELCLFTGPRGTWDIGAGTRTPAGGTGPRAYGHTAVAGCVEDAVRATELGVKCILVADEGVLWVLHRLRVAGMLPADTTLKVSALIGPVNPAAVAVFERLGADSVNVPSDLTTAHITEIRRASRVPLDMYVEAPDDLGGYVRMYEAAELIRRGAPIYLKFGLSKAPGIYPAGAHLRETVVATARERVRRGRLLLDLLERLDAAEGMSAAGARLPGDLERFPVHESGTAHTSEAD
ncbi:U32 family peptidase [Nocardia sp. NEAU-G5]|uniref:U32 family peptidase n=1 Tax=Nocardia albiluteola TaxID=2842303 RepID=A0ABS6AUQ9_9NOCA|nr:U32 family peptidase [Nocardia albiluteola]MBU3061767.1 U32 family peptidase [Nocardia albiluteola]